MTLTAHAVVGASVMALMPAYPAIGVCVAFASHFAVDAIPHWDYPIRSASINPKIGGTMKFDRALLMDGLSIGFDFFFGFALSLLFFSAFVPWQLVILGAFFGMLPDALQFAYVLIKKEPLISLQRFHQWIHSKHRLKTRKIFGIVSQTLFIAAVGIGTLFLI